jgi:hypothetical protein
MNFKNIKTDYIRGRADEDIQKMPFCSRRFYQEILEIESQLDNLIPTWCEPLRSGSFIGMKGLYGVTNLTIEEIGEAKRLLLLRKLRWSGKSNNVIVCYCEVTGKPVALPTR